MIKEAEINDIFEDLESCQVKDVRMAGALIKSLYDDGMIEKNIYDRCKERVDKMIADLSKREKNVQHLEMTFSRDTVKRQKR